MLKTLLMIHMLYHCLRRKLAPFFTKHLLKMQVINALLGIGYTVYKVLSDIL